VNAEDADKRKEENSPQRRKGAKRKCLPQMNAENADKEREERATGGLAMDRTSADQIGGKNI